MESMLNDFLNIRHNVKYYDIKKYMEKLGINVIKTNARNLRNTDYCYIYFFMYFLYY